MTPLRAHACRPALTKMQGIYRHHGPEHQFFVCFYNVVLSFLSPMGEHSWRSSWTLKGAEGSDTEVNLESWEVGQMNGGN